MSDDFSTGKNFFGKVFYQFKKSVFLHPEFLERWPSGRRRAPGERVSAKSASWVRIPFSPLRPKGLKINKVKII